MINIFIVDDHKIVRESLKLILSDYDGIDIVAEAADGSKALDILSSFEGRIDIVLTDKQMPAMDGVTFAKHISKNHPDIKVIMLSMVDDEREIARAFSAGVSGYLLKSVQAQELVFCINHVHQGKYYLISSLVTGFLNFIPSIVKQDMHLKELSDRERMILKLIAKGLTNTEIANQLLLGKRNVEAIRQDLLAKTGCKNSASLIYHAVTNRLL